MTKINLNGKEIEFDRIVGYGCSFMAAAECLDHTLHTDYNTVKKINVLKKKFNYDSSSLYRFLFSKENINSGKLNSRYVSHDVTIDYAINYDMLFADQKEYSWLKRLAEYYSVPCVNRSWSGGSIQSFQYFYLEDKLAGNLRENDLIIIGLTSLARWFYLDDNGGVKHPLFGFLSDSWPNKTVYETMLNTFGSNMPFQVWNALSVLEFFSKIDNVIFIPSFTSDIQYKEWYPLPEGSIIQKLYFDFLNRDSVLKNISFNDIDGFDYQKLDNMAGFHPTIEQQQTYANMIYERLNNG